MKGQCNKNYQCSWVGPDNKNVAAIKEAKEDKMAAKKKAKKERQEKMRAQKAAKKRKNKRGKGRKLEDDDGSDQVEPNTCQPI